MTARPVPARAPLRGVGWVATLVAGMAIVPWLFVASSVLPTASGAERWSVGWALLDAAEAIALFATGALLRRGSPRACDAAVAAASLLLVDASVDVATASVHRVLSLLLALFAEVPLALLCGAIAVEGRRLAHRDTATCKDRRAMPVLVRSVCNDLLGVTVDRRHAGTTDV